jgi:hypothetical protein
MAVGAGWFSDVAALIPTNVDGLRDGVDAVDGWMQRLPEWARDPAFWSVVTAGSLVVSVGGLALGIVALPWFLARVPADYFLGGKHPVTTSRWVLFGRVIRNIVGVILIALGVLLLVLPGPGYMTILAGVIVVNFSWKYRLGRWILRKRGIRPAVDRLRKKAGKSPLLLRTEERSSAPDSETRG